MSFTLCTPVARYPHHPAPPCNKYFIDGKQAKRTYTTTDENGKEIEKEIRPTWYEEVEVSDKSEDVLQNIYEIIQHVEDNNEPWLLVPEKVVKKKDGKFRLSCGEGYLEEEVRRTWLQLDIDLEEEGSNWNDLLLRQRLSVALGELPFLTSSTGMVVHLSNKAFIPTPEYKDRLSIRIYVALDTPATLQDLKITFSPYEPIVDCSMFNKASVHLIQAPECVGTVQRKVQGESVLYIKGEPLSLQKVRATQDYKLRRAAETRFTTCVRSIKSWGYNTAEYKELVSMAREGYFYKNRHKTLYKIIAEAFWVQQNAESVIQLMLSDSYEKNKHGKFTKRRTEFDGEKKDRDWTAKYTILGNERGEKELLEIYEQVKKSALQYFVRPISNHQFDYRFRDPYVADLQTADLENFEKVLTASMKQGDKPLVAIKSPHGSSKTTAIVPLAIKAFSEAHPEIENPRVLYISTLRTIIRGMCPKLLLTCYMDKLGKPSKEITTDADKLGICIKSLGLLTEGKPFHIVILDESEHIGAWSAWENAPYTVLEDLISASELGLFLDADAGDLTYSMIDRAATNNNLKKRMLLDNTGSWIRTQGQVLNFIPRARMLKEIICESAIDNDEFCFVHTDIADKKGDHKLQAHVDAFNQMYGGEIAYKFDSNTPQAERTRLAENTNEVIEELYERGIRIIMVSPIWQSGLRYTGRIPFDKTFGLYLNDFISPKMIVQRIQRVIEVRQHYIYISAASHYVNEKELQKQLEEYIGYTEENTAFVWSRDYGKVFLQKQAVQLEEIYRSNIKLHVYLYWQSFGGQCLMWIDTGESADTEDWFSELLAERKKQLAREEAEIILRDKDKLELLESLYVFQNGDDFKFPIRTNKQVRELINLQRRTELTEELATEVFYLLSTDDSEIVNWAFDGVPWKPPTIDEIIEGNVAPTELGYKVLGKLLRTIQDYLPLEEEKSILNWLLFGKKPLVIEATDLQKSEILRVADNHKQILDSRYDFYRRNITPQHFVKMWFQKVLLCDVKTWTPSKESRAQSKAKIAAFYMDKGWLPKKKNYPVAAYDKEIRKSIKDKLKDELPLQDEEITYLEEYGEILTIYPPTRYNRQRYDVLHGRYTSLIEREIHTVVRPPYEETVDLL